MKGLGHWGVTDEVMVCERNNKGTIMVYNRELQYMRRTEYGGMGKFEETFADCHGNLYVIDISNLCIQVFNNKGVLLRSFGCNSKNVKIFRAPIGVGVCVCDRYVFVSDVTCGSSCVFVFTVAGDCVTFLGKYGSKEGQFKTMYMSCV